MSAKKLSFSFAYALPQIFGKIAFQEQWTHSDFHPLPNWPPLNYTRKVKQQIEIKIK